MSINVSLKSSSIGTWRQIAGASASRFINTIGVVLLVIILNTRLSVELIGLYFFLFAVIDLLSNIAGGLGQAIRKRVSAKEGKQSDYLTTALVSTFVAQGIIIVFLLVIAFSVPSNLIPDIVSRIDILLMFASVLLLVTQSTAKIMLNYNSGLGYPSRSEWLGRALPGVLFFIITVFVIYLGMDIAYVFIGGSISYAFSTLIMFLTTKPDLTSKPSIKKLRSIFRFGKWSIPNKIVTNFYGSLDIIVLGIIVTSTVAGYYESTNSLSNLAYIVPFGVSAVISVKISGLDAEGKTDEIRSLMSNVLPISMVLPVTALSIFIVFGEFSIEQIYGSNFSGAYLFLVGLSIKEVITSYRKPIEALTYGIDSPEKPFYSNICAVIFNIITVVPFVLLFGGIGVVISTILAEIIRSSVLTYLTPSELNVIKYKYLLLPFAISAPLSILFWFFRRHIFNMTDTLTILYVLAFACLYIGILYIIYNKLNILRSQNT